MPLIISPIDGSPMRHINRHGVDLDICPTTGGIWLDKGELEKLMAIMREDAVDDAAAMPRQRRSSQHGPDRYYDDDDYDRHKRKHPKGKMSRLMDIFDF